MLSRVPLISRYTLRTDKMRATLARKSRSTNPDLVGEASLQCDVLPKPADKAAEDGNLTN
jgi:hypothetical protein